MADFIVGLTGGIGSGKSCVADFFAENGAGLVDADVIAHQLTAADGEAIPLLIAAFGDDILEKKGGLDRKKMREIAFSDDGARKRLEDILHPLIRQKAAALSKASTALYVVLVVPLLIETGGWRTRCQRVLVVDCPEDLQISRVMARSQMSAAAVKAIMATQASRKERLEVADDVIENDGNWSALLPALQALHEKYTRLAAGRFIYDAAP